MTVRTLLKATDARFQSLKIGPLPPLITGDPLPPAYSVFFDLGYPSDFPTSH